MIDQIEISLPPYRRGFHLITTEILRNLPNLPDKGILSLLLKHTSAAITINENADRTVRDDFGFFFSKLIPYGTQYFL